jgi:acyl carrier protein
MTPDETEAWLRDLVTRISGKSASGTDLEADLGEAFGLDSLGRLEVLAEIEDEFDFFFDDNELVNASTLSKMLDAIDRKLRAVTVAEV